MADCTNELYAVSRTDLHYVSTRLVFAVYYLLVLVDHHVAEGAHDVRIEL